MTTLIVGGTGFIGAHVARDLLARGRRVDVLDRSPDIDTLRSVIGTPLDRVPKVERGDAVVAVQVLSAVANTRPDAIVHLASPLPPESEFDATASLNAMVESFVNVLEAARIFGTRRVVWASATSVFGRPEAQGGDDVIVHNDAPHFPVTLYGIYKSACERLADFYFRERRVDSIGLRFAQGYGPRKTRGRPFGYELFEHVARGEPYDVPYADDLINWQYADDIARLIVAAIDAPTTQTRVFNTTGDVITMKASLDILRELEPRAQLRPIPGTTGLAWRYDTEALDREIGVFPITPAREGFARTLEALR